MKAEQFLDRARPFFAPLPGKLTFGVGFADGYELRFASEPFDYYGVVVVNQIDLEIPERADSKLFEAQGLAETMIESILHGQVPLRNGYPKREAAE